MQSWILLALLAPAIYTAVNYIDKYVVEHKVKDYRGIPIYGSIVGLITGTSIWFVTGFATLPLFDSIIVLFTGMLTLFGYALYFNALSKSQTSYIIGLFQLTPVMVLLLSYVFLEETISLYQLMGFLLVLFAVFSLSIKREKEKFKLDKAFSLIIISDILFALASVIIKFAISANSFSKILVYESWGIALGGLVIFLVFPSVRRAFKKTTRSVGKKVLGILLLNEFVFIISKVITFLAIALGPVALVSVLGGTQVFYGIIYGLILTLIAPKIFNEETDRRNLIRKFLFMGILFGGIWLIQ